jgi:hypothetical protein
MRREANHVTRGVVLFSAFLGLATAIHAADGVKTNWLARYRVEFGATEAGVPTAEVEATLIWTAGAKACPKSVDVDMFEEDEFPKGYGSFVHSFEAVPHSAETLSVSAGRYRLPIPGNGAVSFRYTVVLEHDASNWGPGPDEAPYRFEGGAFWTGRALFITAPGSQVEVSLAAPKGQRISVSFEPIAGRAGSYRVTGESRLRDGKTIDLDVVLGGNPGDVVPEKPHTEATLDVLPETDPMAQQIRTSLLGRTLDKRD